MKKSFERDGVLMLALLFVAVLGGWELFRLLNGLLGGSYGTRPCLFLFAVLLVWAAVLTGKKRWTEARAVDGIFVASLCLKLDYIFYTSCYMRQQDTLIFDYPMGHLGYIGYLYYNHHLPDFDTRTAWSFSHPPLHHAIAALWVKLNVKLGVELELAIENIQLLTVFYSMGILLFAYLILKEFEVKGKALYAWLLLIAFHPTLVLLSGSVNNDELALFFMMGAVLYTIRWYRDSSLKNILILAVMIGCAMMAKVSAGLVAPAVAVVFLVKLWRERKNWKRYFGQFIPFGLVVFPLGLWAPLRNKLLFGVPLNYAEKLKLDDPQFIGNIPVLKRFFDFSPYQFAHLDVQFEEAGTYREFNVFLGLLKTAIFGQTDFYQESQGLTVTGTVLFWMNVVLVVLAAYAIVRSIVTYRRHLAMEKWFLLLGSAVYLLSYFQFCLEYPHICTMNVRYILLLLFTGLFFACIWGQEREADGHGAWSRALLWISGVWACVSAAMFVLLGAL